jgi:hypothetical protein
MSVETIRTGIMRKARLTRSSSRHTATERAIVRLEQRPAKEAPAKSRSRKQRGEAREKKADSRQQRQVA